MSRTQTITLTALFSGAALALAGCSGATETSVAPFEPVADAPAGSDGAEGDATISRSDDGTAVTVELTGLTPNAKYVAHVHNQPCAEDSGGRHFQFEPGGSELPPNEIHLALTADADGAASANTDADRKAGPEAVSVVVHYQDAKMLCADL